MQEPARDRSLFLEPIVSGSLHEHALNHPKRLAPRSKVKQRDFGKLARWVLIILVILVVIAIWSSSRVGASPVGATLSNY
jgi:hypothetical protein